MFKQYLGSKFKTIFCFSGIIMTFIVVGRLYGIPWGGCIYTAALCLFVMVVIMLYSFYRYVLKVKNLKEQKLRIEYTSDEMPKAINGIELEYQEMIEVLSDKIAEITSKNDGEKSDLIEYYTMWVHQIKTPIAAMGLLLQTGDFDGKAEMQMELFKIEQYVSMVLQYLRLGSEQTDFLFKEQPLDPIIRENVKKYSTSFIRRKLSLDYEPVNATVLTDEKWLSFVIEQVLSNALKYTYTGKISIYMDKDSANTLVIEDTGIGIQAEDIPRVFDRGYTGYNGRNDKKSTGIGLYLCRNILKKLGHSMNIESQVGVGTKVKIDLGYEKGRFE